MARRPAATRGVRWRARWLRLQRTRLFRTFSHFTDVGGGVLAAGMSYQAMFAVFAGLWIGFGVALFGGTVGNPLLASFALLVGVLIWFNFICRVLFLTASWIATGSNSELGLVGAHGDVESAVRGAAAEVHEGRVRRLAAGRGVPE